MEDVQKEAFLNRVHGLYIMHPRNKKVFSVLDSARRKRDHLFLVGDSGVGKSKLLQRYAESNPGHTEIDEKGTEVDITPVVYAELPTPFTLLELFQTVVKALGAPQFNGARIGDVKRQAFDLIEKQRVEMLILDEMNYILVSRWATNKEAMEAIKHISNIGNISVILAGNPETTKLTEINFQYFRRFPQYELKRFEECNEEFCELLREMEVQLQLPSDLGIGDPNTEIPQILYDMSQGILQVVSHVLRTAFEKMMEEHEYKDASDPLLFLQSLEDAQQYIMGTSTNMDKFIQLLQTSSKN